MVEVGMGIQGHALDKRSARRKHEDDLRNPTIGPAPCPLPPPAPPGIAGATKENSTALGAVLFRDGRNQPAGRIREIYFPFFTCFACFFCLAVLAGAFLVCFFEFWDLAILCFWVDDYPTTTNRGTNLRMNFGTVEVFIVPISRRRQLSEKKSAGLLIEARGHSHTRVSLAVTFFGAPHPFATAEFHPPKNRPPAGARCVLNDARQNSSTVFCLRSSRRSRFPFRATGVFPFLTDELRLPIFSRNHVPPPFFQPAYRRRGHFPW